jgi:SAM-dependent methyltransferase
MAQTTWLTAIRSQIGGLIWGRRFAQGGIRTWMHEPVVRRYINTSVSGSPDCWPIDWLRSLLGSHRFSTAVSLGCGDGPLERDLLAKGICSSLLGIDISLGALELARERAAAQRLVGVEYRQGDLNSLRLPGRGFEAAFFHQALHHVENLDGCLTTTASALHPGGLLYLDEYVGPSRGDWTHALIAEADRLFVSLPKSVKRRRHIAAPIDRRDPTEAVRSSRILPTVAHYFQVQVRRDYGGNFLAVIHPHLRLDHLSPATRDEVLLEIIQAEQEHLKSGVASYYTVLMATPLPQPQGGIGQSVAGADTSARVPTEQE